MRDVTGSSEHRLWQGASPSRTIRSSAARPPKPWSANGCGSSGARLDDPLNAGGVGYQGQLGDADEQSGFHHTDCLADGPIQTGRIIDRTEHAVQDQVAA